MEILERIENLERENNCPIKTCQPIEMSPLGFCLYLLSGGDWQESVSS